MMRPAVSSSRGRNNCGHRRVARRAIGRHTKMQNMRNVKLPDPKIISGIVQTAVFGGAGAYGLYHSFFNVEGGHRAISGSKPFLEMCLGFRQLVDDVLQLSF